MTDELDAPMLEAALLTKHHKLALIAPALATAGIQVRSTDAFDTDTLGSFSGETPRLQTPLECARTKARLAAELTGLPIGIGSEGSGDGSSGDRSGFGSSSSASRGVAKKMRRLGRRRFSGLHRMLRAAPRFRKHKIRKGRIGFSDGSPPPRPRGASSPRSRGLPRHKPDGLFGRCGCKMSI